MSKRKATRGFNLKPEYINSRDLTDEQMRVGLANGWYEFWRKDEDGEVWLMFWVDRLDDDEYQTATEGVTMSYVCSSDLLDREILAGRIDGTLLPWRCDAEGRQWYKTVDNMMIHGVTEQPEVEAFDDDEFDDSDIEADDD